MKYGTFLHPNTDTYTLKLLKMNSGNNAYEYGESENRQNPIITFKGRPASSTEKKSYRVVKGVHGTSDSVMIFSANLPNEIEVDDKVEYLGEVWIVKSVGYYFNENNLVNASIFNKDYILNRSPKGITLG